MPKITMSEKDALAVIHGLLQYNARITMACARERTGWSGDMLEGLVQRNQNKVGLILARGYKFICTVEEKKRSSKMATKRHSPPKQ